MAKRNISHIGSTLDDFLSQEGVLGEVSARAIKRVIAWQLAEAMKTQGVTKTAMAERMHTSRSMLDRLLDETDTGLTIETLSRAAQALGYRVKVELAAA
ncbi:MAG TPA: helix-turn-helix transcriptional regulator [Rhodanobacteraceae bacterium]|nr:helix-turn-helix transcriptional regulator [Rhodanobacteraceae bacterium]